MVKKIDDFRKWQRHFFAYNLKGKKETGRQKDKQTDQLFFAKNEVRRRTLTEIGEGLIPNENKLLEKASLDKGD